MVAVVECPVAQSFGLGADSASMVLSGLVQDHLRCTSNARTTERGRARSQRCPRSGQLREGPRGGLLFTRGVSASPAALHKAGRSASRGPLRHRPPCDVHLRTSCPESAPGKIEDVIDFAGGAHDISAENLVASLLTDVMDDFHFSEESVQDVDSPEDAEGEEEEVEEEAREEARDAQFQMAVGSPTIAESDEEVDDAVHCAIPSAPAGLVDMAPMDNDDYDEVCILMDGDELDDDHEMEAECYIRMALRLAKVAVATGMEEVEAPGGPVETPVFALEAVESSVSAPALVHYTDDSCWTQEQAVEALRVRAHQVLRQASSDGSLFSAFKQMQSMLSKSATLPQPCGEQRFLGPTSEATELRAEMPKLAEFLEPVEHVQLAELVAMDKQEPTKQKEADISKTPKYFTSHVKARPSTSIPETSRAMCLAATGRPSSSPAATRKTRELFSQAEPVEVVIRSLHTSRSRRNVIGGVVRKTISQCEEQCDKQQTPAMFSRPSSTGLRRHRTKRTDSAAAFRMDSPAGNKHDDNDTRESSLTRAYEALGAEMHCLDDVCGEVHSHNCFLNSVGRPISSGSQCRRIPTTEMLGHAPFAMAPDPHVGLRGAPCSAMALDLDGDTTMASFTSSRRPTPSSQSRHSSSGAVRVTKSKQSFGVLPPLSTSKSTSLLPSLATKPGHAKHRSQDSFAWSMGDLSSSKSKWGSTSLSSVF